MPRTLSVGASRRGKDLENAHKSVLQEIFVGAGLSTLRTPSCVSNQGSEVIPPRAPFPEQALQRRPCCITVRGELSKRPNEGFGRDIGCRRPFDVRQILGRSERRKRLKGSVHSDLAPEECFRGWFLSCRHSGAHASDSSDGYR